MSLGSDLGFCLTWVTEQPYIHRARQSPYFQLSGEEFYLTLSLEKTNNQYTCSVCLHPRVGGNISKSVIWADCIVIAETSALFSYYSPFPNQKSGNYLMFKNFYSKNPFTSREDPKDCRVICRMKWAEPISLQINNKTISMSANEKESIDKSVQVSQEVVRDVEALSSDIYVLLEEEILPDFKLQCKDQVFSVHRSILAARSEVFRAMFRSRMQETESGSTTIEDLDAPVLQLMLKFIYSGKLDGLFEDIVADLYVAADKYSVRSLCEACSYLMVKNLNEGNCISYLSIAESHSDPVLKDGVLTFILEHPGIFKTAEWLTFSEQYPVLTNKVHLAYITSIIP